MLKVILTLTLILTACAPAHSEPSCGFTTDSFGSRITWQKNLPIKLYVDKSFPTAKITLIKEGIAVWEKATKRKLFDLQDEPAKFANFPIRDGQNTIFTEKYDDFVTLGQTRVWLRGDQILETDISFDPEYGITQEVVTHELGHALGLNHTDEKMSIMYEYSATGQDLSEQDLKNIRCGY